MKKLLPLLALALAPALGCQNSQCFLTRLFPNNSACGACAPAPCYDEGVIIEPPVLAPASGCPGFGAPVINGGVIQQGPVVLPNGAALQQLSPQQPILPGPVNNASVR